MTSFVDSHDWQIVLACSIEKMDHSPFELWHINDTFRYKVLHTMPILTPVPLRQVGITRNSWLAFVTDFHDIAMTTYFYI